MSAKIVANKIGCNIKFDKRLREISFGVFNAHKTSDWKNFFHNKKERYTRKPAGGENYRDIKKRVRAFLKDINHQYKNKRILVIAHAAILFSFQSIILGYNEEQERKYVEKLELSTGELRKLN
jgi:alpha-ribazole phosphatase/probable phosphoglycerate mutase